MGLKIDFEKHNEEVKEIWKRFHEGNPVRVPMILGVSTRYYMFTPSLNPDKITFEKYTENPDLMFDFQLKQQHWLRHNLIQDAEMGMPKNWSVYVDFQNYYEAAWFGCEVVYRDGQVPDTIPLLTDAQKNLLFDRGIPEPFTGGWMKRSFEYYDYFKEKTQNYEFMGIPVTVANFPGTGTDGPLTVACNLRGTTQLMMDIYTDPDYVHKLMDYVTEATIVRIQAYRKMLDQPIEGEQWGFADDSVQLISDETFSDFVLPYHKRLISIFGKKGPNSIHLCGDASRHFKALKDELNITSFDTGFPIDHGAVRRELEADVQIYGGPHVMLLKDGPPKAIVLETKRILQSGVMKGGKFVLREGNNLAPGTPPEHIMAMYETNKKYGRY